MTGAPTRSYWAVALRGDERDLASWQRLLDPRFDLRIERLPQVDEPLLRSDAFVQMNDAGEVWKYGQVLVERLNGIMRCIDRAGKVEASKVCEVMSDGNIRIAAFASLHVEGRADSIAIGASVGGDPSPPQPSPAQKWAATAANDPVVAEMLINYGKGTDWVNLYKTYEGIRSLAIRTGGYKSKSWYPGDDTDEDFRENANYLNRHGRRDNSQPPKRELSLLAARDLVDTMLNRIMGEIAP